MNRILPIMLITVGVILSVALAGTLDPSQQRWYDHYKKQPNAPVPEKMPINTDAEPDLSEGMVPMFNGRDLTGWTPRGGRAKFTVEDGMIVGTCVPGSPSTYLCTDKEDYRDFLFTCEMKWRVNGNTGVMFRAATRTENNGRVTVYGPQAEMEEENKGRGWSGGIYGQSCGGWYYPLWLDVHEKARRAHRNGQWNRLTILARGDVVKTWVNGVPCAHWINDQFTRGFFGLQIHSGKQGTILWRNLRVKELK